MCLFLIEITKWVSFLNYNLSLQKILSFDNSILTELIIINETCNPSKAMFECLIGGKYLLRLHRFHHNHLPVLQGHSQILKI